MNIRPSPPLGLGRRYGDKGACEPLKRQISSFPIKTEVLDTSYQMKLSVGGSSLAPRYKTVGHQHTV